MSLYGTRDAAANFQAEVQRVMTKASFTVNQYSPSCCCYPQKELLTLAYGDDFVTTRNPEDVAYARAVLESRFKISTTVLGRGKGEVREGRL